MDKKAIIIAIVAAIVIIAAIAAFVLMNNGNSDDKKSIDNVTVENNGSISDTIIQQGLNGATGSDLAITINNAAADDAAVKIKSSGFKKIADASKTLTLINGDKKATLSKDAVKALSNASGELTLDFSTLTDSSSITKKIGDKYTEARALASVNVKDSSGKTVNAGPVSFSIPYKLDKKELETAEKAVQWDGSMKSSKASYSNGVATISGKANENVCLAFMSAEDAAYYPISYVTLVSGQEVNQTVTHRPENIVVFWDSSIELALLFGLKDKISFAFGDPNYVCLNPEVQSDYNSLSIVQDEQTKIPGYIETIRANEPDFMIGWSSTFTTTPYGGLTTYEEINKWGTQCLVVNRPSNSLEDYYTSLEHMGKVFNDKATADKLIDDFRQASNEFKAKLATAGITEENKRKAIILETGSGEDVTSMTMPYGSAFLTGDLITQAGGINLYDGGMGRITIEELLNLCLPNGEDNIDVIILFDNGGGPEKTVSDFKNSPAYKTLGESADVYSLTFAQLYMGGVMQRDILSVIFGMLYPELV